MNKFLQISLLLIIIFLIKQSLSLISSTSSLSSSYTLKKIERLKLNDNSPMYINIFTSLSDELKSPATLFGKVFFVTYIGFRFFILFLNNY